MDTVNSAIKAWEGGRSGEEGSMRGRMGVSVILSAIKRNFKKYTGSWYQKRLEENLS